MFYVFCFLLKSFATQIKFTHLGFVRRIDRKMNETTNKEIQETTVDIQPTVYILSGMNFKL